MTTVEEFKTIAIVWKERKRRMVLFFLKLVALFASSVAVVILVWELSASRGTDLKGIYQFPRNLVLIRQIRSILQKRDFDERIVKKDSTCTTKYCMDAAYLFLGSIDPEENPCDNFYNFTCGNHIDDFGMKNLQRSVTKKLESFIKSPIEENDSKYVKMQKTYYQACMNVASIEEDKNETFKRKLKKAGKWPVLDGDEWTESEFSWGDTMAKCRDVGLYFNLFLTVDGCKIVHPINNTISYTLEVSPPYKVRNIEVDLRQKYTDLMTNVVKILGAPGNSSTIDESMKEVMRFEIELTKIVEETPSDDTHFHKTMEDIENEYPFIPWFYFLKDAIISREREILFNAEAYIGKLKELLDMTPKRVMANYILWKAIEAVNQFLSSDIRREFEIYANISRYYKFSVNRDDVCYKSTKFVFSYLSEAEYIKNHNLERRAVQDMIERIKSVLYQHIENSSLMSQSDREYAHIKLKNMTVVIGNAEDMYDESKFAKLMGYDTFNISDRHNTLEIVCEVERKRAIHGMNFSTPKYTIHHDGIYKATSRIDNLKYITYTNTLFVPAASFDGVLFSIYRPDYLNYGALGPMIGHAIAHGFGLKGYEDYDKVTKGVFWTAECLLKNCNDIGIENKIRMNCEETYEENFADYAGINLAYEAYTQLQDEIGTDVGLLESKYTPTQLFWIAHVSTMCDNVRGHSKYMLPFQRVLGSLRNTVYFAQDFHCPLGSNMNPRRKCKIL